LVALRKWLLDCGHTFSSWLKSKMDGDTEARKMVPNNYFYTAAERLQRALALEPSNDTYLYFTVLVLLESHADTLALQTAEHFCSSNRTNVNGFLCHAKLLRHLSKPELVEREVLAWLRVAELDPSSDEAFTALLMHYKRKKVTCVAMLKVLMGRMDVSLTACDQLSYWKLFAALLVARKRALLSKDTASLGHSSADAEFLTRLYTWKRRYWSREAWRYQQEELNTATKITILLCAMLIYGKTRYTLNAVASLAGVAEMDMKFHMGPFGAVELLNEHLALVATAKQLRSSFRKPSSLRADRLRGDIPHNLRRMIRESDSHHHEEEEEEETKATTRRDPNGDIIMGRRNHDDHDEDDDEDDHRSGTSPENLEHMEPDQHDDVGGGDVVADRIGGVFGADVEDDQADQNKNKVKEKEKVDDLERLDSLPSHYDGSFESTTRSFQLPSSNFDDTNKAEEEHVGIVTQESGRLRKRLRFAVDDLDGVGGTLEDGSFDQSSPPPRKLHKFTDDS